MLALFIYKLVNIPIWSHIWPVICLTIFTEGCKENDTHSISKRHYKYLYTKSNKIDATDLFTKIYSLTFLSRIYHTVTYKINNCENPFQLNKLHYSNCVCYWADMKWVIAHSNLHNSLTHYRPCKRYRWPAYLGSEPSARLSLYKSHMQVDITYFKNYQCVYIS